MRTGQNCIKDFVHRTGDVDHLHLAAMHHDFPDANVFKIKHAMQHRAFSMMVTDDNVIGVQFNRTAQFTLAVHARAFAAAKQAQGCLNNHLNALRDGCKNNHQNAHRAGHTQRHRIGMLKRIGFWQNLRKHQNKCGHGDGGVNNTVFTKQFDHHRGRKGRGQNIDHIVAQQNRPKQTFLILAQPVNRRSSKVAILFLVMHDRTRRCRKRGFRAREKCRQHQQEKNHDNRDCHSGPSPKSDRNRTTLSVNHL